MSRYVSRPDADEVADGSQVSWAPSTDARGVPRASLDPLLVIALVTGDRIEWQIRALEIAGRAHFEFAPHLVRAPDLSGAVFEDRRLSVPF